MIGFLRLAIQSLKNRKLTTYLTVLSIALSVALLISVERIRRASEEGFTQTISQTDLIVGARTGPINLILYTVFNMGSATNNISMQSYEKFKNHPAVDWTIPYSLGDGHRGFRVVATDASFFEHYHYRGNQKINLAQGRQFQGWNEVVLGSQVASELGYKLEQKIVVTHGVTRGEGILQHDDKPFTVVGIMQQTGTALDRSLYMSLESMEAIHIDWQSGMPNAENKISAEQIKPEDLKPKNITAFFLRTKSRVETLRLQREINTFEQEAVMAIIPGVTLQELWQNLGYVEKALKIVSWLVVIVGLISMLIAIMTSLNERRREMAILRSIGAQPKHILILFLLEAGFLSFVGIITGLIFQAAVFLMLEKWLLLEFGIVLSGDIFSSMELLYILIVFAFGLLIGVVPAIQAKRLTLKDGLSVKV